MASLAEVYVLDIIMMIIVAAIIFAIITLIVVDLINSYGLVAVTIGSIIVIILITFLDYKFKPTLNRITKS